MNKKTVLSASDNTIRKLKVLANKKKSVRSALMVTAEKLTPKAKQFAVSNKRNDLYKNKKTVLSASDNIILELKVKAEDLAVVAKEKEVIRLKLEDTAKELKVKAEDLAVVAKEKEVIRLKLEDTAKELKVKAEDLAVVAKEKEVIGSKLMTTAGELAATAEKKENIREKLVVIAKQLAVTAEEKEDIRRKLEMTAKELKVKAEDLAVIAEEKEDIRKKLAVTAEELRLKAQALAVIAEEKEDIRLKLKDTAKKLALKAKQLVMTAKEKENVRLKLAITAKELIQKGKEVEGEKAKLENANVKLKSLDKLKDQFVSIASHELRTPLTAIDGIVSMILDGEYGKVNKNLKHPLEDVSTSSERLIHLVNDLLNFSRIQAGRLKYIFSDFSISNTILKIVKLLSPLAQQKNLKLQIGQIDKVNVQADRDKVEEIFDNLIGNSLKFTDKGSITISTKVNGEQINIYIADTGMGISKKDQQKLFGQFQQLESGGKTAGTGLGLHISRKLVRKMGGELWIEKSKIGIGSTFAFSIPKSKSNFAKKKSKNKPRHIPIKNRT